MEKPPELPHPFYPGDRTYYVSDERLRAFRKLTPEQKLRWVDEMATFLRMAKISRKNDAKGHEMALPSDNPTSNK